MNLERFHTIIAKAKQDTEESRVPKLVGQLVGHLGNLVKEPANPEHQKNISSVREDLKQALLSARSNAYSPNWRNILRTHGLNFFIAGALLESVEQTFSGNEITPQLTLEKLQKIQSSLSESLQNCGNILGGFKHLAIQTDDLGEGECEISITIPRDHVESNPSALGKEFGNLEKLFGPFSELATGQVQKFEIRSISSTDFTIILGVMASSALAAQTVKIIAEAVRSIIAIYKDVLEIRTMKAKLAKMNVDEDARKKSTISLEQLVTTTIQKGIEKAADELLQKFSKVTDKHRANEVRNSIQINMSEIASRIDHQFDIETRMGGLPKPKPKEGESKEETPESSDMIEMRDALEIIDNAHKEQLKFEREGEPILSLSKPSLEVEGTKR